MNSADNAIEEAERAGFDLNLIDCNLALSPEERLLRHDSALELVLALREAGAAAYAQSASPLQRLADAGLEFVVVGDFAGALHGSTVVTNHVAVCAVLSPENVARIRVAFANLHPLHRSTPRKLSFLEHPSADQGVVNLYLETDAGIVDILSSILGVGDFHRLRQRAIEVPLFGRTCAVISLEDLITAKEAVGREKDLLAVKELRAIAAKRKPAK